MSEKKKSVYATIADDIIEKISADVYPVGSLLPPERELMGIYNVQRTTVRRGLNILSLEGYITKAAGLGSLVNSKVPIKQSGTKSEKANIVPASHVNFKKDGAILLPGKDMDALPKFLLDLIVSLNKSIGFMTSSENEISKSSKVIAVDVNPQKENDVCLALCQSDERRSITLDNDKSAYVALTYLESLGHRDIAYIGTDASLTFENAIYDSFSTVNSFFDEELVSLSGGDEKAGFDGFSALHRRHGGKFSAVCTVNDEVAKGVIKAAKYYKISVPEELSVISLCSSGKSSVDAIVYDTDALADEVLYCLEKSSRIATVLFSGVLKSKGSCGTVKDKNTSEKNMSNFLL